MRTRIAIYTLTTFILAWCNNRNAFCTEIDAPIEAEQLRLFLLKGYTSAKSVLEDVRIEYKRTQVPVNPIPLSPALLEKFNIKEQSDILRFTNVQEYIQKHGKERWLFLYQGKSAPTGDVSYRAGLIATKNSPAFRVFDGQYILDYYPATDGFTQVGRATLDASKTALFESYGSTVYAPVKFFGYYPGLMPDDVLSSPQLKIETKPEKISDLLTYKVSAPIQINKTKYNVVYWLTPERSCLPVKIEVERNGRLKRLLEAKEFVELDDGRWAIKSILQRNFVYREDKEGRTENINLIYTIRKIKLHPEIDEDKIFSTLPDNLPKGAQIIDKLSGLKYFKGEGSVSNRRISDVIKKSIETINDIPNVTETEVAEETVSERTELIDDANKPLFSDTGVLASQTSNQTSHSTDNRTSILGLALAGTGFLMACLLVIVFLRRSARIKGKQNDD